MDTQPRCPKCQASDLGHLDSLLDSGQERLDVSYQALGSIRYHIPRWNVHGDAVERSKLAKVIRTPERTKAGTVEAFVCTRCGYVERHVQDPRWLPFDKLEGFTWVNDPPVAAGADEVPR